MRPPRCRWGYKVTGDLITNDKISFWSLYKVKFVYIFILSCICICSQGLSVLTPNRNSVSATVTLYQDIRNRQVNRTNQSSICRSPLDVKLNPYKLPGIEKVSLNSKSPKMWNSPLCRYYISLLQLSGWQKVVLNKNGGWAMRFLCQPQTPIWIWDQD